MALPTLANPSELPVVDIDLLHAGCQSRLFHFHFHPTREFFPGKDKTKFSFAGHVYTA